MTPEAPYLHTLNNETLLKDCLCRYILDILAYLKEKESRIQPYCGISKVKGRRDYNLLVFQDENDIRTPS